jgi:hypothetical protein
MKDTLGERVLSSKSNTNVVSYLHTFGQYHNYRFAIGFLDSVEGDVHQKTIHLMETLIQTLNSGNGSGAECSE